MKVFQLFGEISVDKKSAIRSMNDVEGHARGSSGRIGKMFGNLGRAIGTAIKVGAVAAGVAIVGIGVAAIKAAANYEQAMAMVKAVTGATGEEFTKLDVKAKELGLSSKFTMTEIAAGMEYLGRAGFTAIEIVDAMSGVSALAAAQMMDLASAADIVSNVLTGMGLAASDAERVANVFAATTASANVNVHELGESFKYFAPLAKQFKIPLETAAAMIGKLGDAGIKGTLATRTLATAFTRLADPTEEMTNMMEELGVTFFDQEGAFVGVEDMIGNLEVSLAGLNDQQRAAAMSTLFGAEATKQMNILVGEGEEGLREYIGTITDTTAAFEQQAIQNATMQGQLTILKGSWNLLMVTIGTAVLPMITSLLQNHVIPLVNGITAWINEMGGLSGIFAIVKAKIIEFVGGSENMETIINAVKTALGWLWDRFKDFASWLGTVFSELIQSISAMIQGDWSGAMTHLKQIVLETWDALPIPQNIKDGITTFFADIKEKGVAALVAIKEQNIETWASFRTTTEEETPEILSLWDELKAAASNLGETFGIVFGGMGETLEDTTEGHTTFAEQVTLRFGLLVTMFEEGMKNITTGMNTLAALLEGEWSDAWTALKDRVVAIWTTIIETFDFSLITTAWNTGWGSWWDQVTTDIASIKQWGIDVIDMFKAGLQEKWSDITTWWSNAWTTLVDTLTSWMPGWLRGLLGIDEAMDQLDTELAARFAQGPSVSVTGAAESYGEQVATGIGDGVGEYDFAPTGLTLVESLETGMESSSVASKLEDIGLGMLPPLISGMAGYSYDSAGFSIAQGVGGGVGSYSAENELFDAGTGAAGKIAGGLAGYDMDPTGEAAVTSIAEGVDAHAPEIMDKGAAIAYMVEFGLRGEDPALHTAGYDAAGTIDDGIASQFESGISGRLSDAIRSYIDDLIAAMQDALDAHSPSRRAMKLGTDFIKGMAIGIQGGARNIKDILNDIMPAATTAFSTSFSSIIEPSMPQPAMAMAGGGDIYVNIESATIREEADVRRVAVQIMDLTEDERRGQGRDSLI